MKATDCVVSNCDYCEKISKGRYRCIHPNIPEKRSWKHVKGIQVIRLEKCPKDE